MALVTRSADASMDTNTIAFAPQISGLTAGEALDACAPCYIKSSDGLVYMSNATGTTEPSEVVGFTPRAAKIGQPVTLYGNGSRMNYGSALVPGDRYYIAATAGRLDTVATVGDAVGVAQAITATDIRVTRMV